LLARIDAETVKPHANLPEGRILDIPVSLATHDAVLHDVAQRVRRHERGGHIAITNTESMYHALRQPAHLRYIQSAQHSLCDGVGVIVPGWFWGLRIARYNGPILMLDCSRQGVREGWRHFYFGGKEGVADQMVERLQSMFPGLVSVGTYCPPFRPMTAEEDEALVKQINDARPDFVWVGLGLLKQEQWIADHLGRIRAPWMVGVGAAFDYHSGAIPWAPAPLRALGLEWVFRLLLQPRLRGKRYWWSFIFSLEAAVKGLARFEFLRKRVSSR
jgi:N-acetylglucosaminyldiphosphoundecaprenol N-acetyl-beta-D-mannosaminyltransferase